ncbi:MAG: InlB B-repeat-containing protein [Solirubrobacteraceae bacterium]
MRPGTPITLTATANAGSEFKGFSAPCTGPSPCDLAVSADVSVTATFSTRPPVVITVFIRGAGTVTSAPPGIACSSRMCTGQFPAGTTLTLSAAPAQGSDFRGWTGACSGSDTCQIVADQPRRVVASFGQAPQTG